MHIAVVNTKPPLEQLTATIVKLLATSASIELLSATVIELFTTGVCNYISKK
jgi:hypothetical protein